MNRSIPMRGALLGAWLLVGLPCCGGSADPDDSVKDSSFCEAYLKRCPDQKPLHDECALYCANGVNAASTSDVASVCWEIYCEDELRRCKPAGVFSTDPDTKECAMAHGWLTE